MRADDYVAILLMLLITALLVIIKLLVCIALAYGLLWCGDYLAVVWDEFPLEPYEIEVTHVLVATLLFAILLHAGPDIKSPIDRLDRSLSYALGGVEQKAHEITLKLDVLDDIRSSVDSIQLEVSLIKSDLDSRGE